MRVVGQQLGELVVLGVALEPQRTAAIGRLAHQAWRAIGIGLDRQAGQQAAVGVELEFGQAFGVVGIVAARLGVLALQAMRADHPEIAVRQAHAFQIGFFCVLPRKIQQLGQGETLAFAEAQRLALGRLQLAQAIHRAGFVAGHPQPVVGKRRAGQIAVHQRAGCELQPDAVRNQGFLGHGNLVGGVAKLGD